MPIRCFVAGSPIAHSRSPLIHNHWIEANGLDGSYERREVTPDTIIGLLAEIRWGEYAGGNFTIPLKQVLPRLLDELTPAAKAVGAVNTVFAANGLLIGDNTDAHGFLAHLDQSRPDWAQHAGMVLLLGAGGASRAILHALVTRGLRHIVVVNRSRGRAEALIDPYRGHIYNGQEYREDGRQEKLRIETADWSALPQLTPSAGLIVNTTSLGMEGQPELPLAHMPIRPGATVYDIVYAPLRTALLVHAGRSGAVPVDGLGMLLHQAAPAFARWFGLAPTVTPQLRALVEADLAAPRHAPSH